MTEPDLAHIEQTLGIRLPEAYRRTMLAFPVPACAGNHDTGLWDNAPELIRLNQELRAGRSFVDPWPPEYVAGLRDDLEGEGVDPDGDPVAARKVQQANEKESLRLAMVAVT